MATALAALTGAAVITTATAPNLGQFNRYDATAGDLSVTLPALSGLNVGARMLVQKIVADVSGNSVAFSCAGADTFDDASTSIILGNAGEQTEMQVVEVAGTKYWKTLGSGAESVALKPTAVKTSGHTAAARQLVPCDATSGGFTVQLPTAPADATIIEVKKIDSSANAIIVQRGGSDVFNTAGGATTLQVVVPDQTVTMQYDSATAIWYVTGHGLPLAALDERYAGEGRVLTLSYAAEPAINTNLYGLVKLYGLTGDITSMTTNLTGTPWEGQKLDIWFSDDDTLRTITWGASFGGYLMENTYRDNHAHLQRLIYSGYAGQWIGYDISAEPFKPIRAQTVMSSATPTLNTDRNDQLLIYAQAADITSMTTNLTGNPVEGQELAIRITDDGTARAITWGAKFTGILLSTTAGGGKTHLQRLRYDAVAGKWAGYLADATGY